MYKLCTEANLPYFKCSVAYPQQQRRRVVEAPFVRASQVAVLYLIREKVEGIQALEQRRRIGGCRVGGTSAAEAAGRHLSVVPAEGRLLLRRRIIG